jgi:hypothetical protein
MAAISTQEAEYIRTWGCHSHAYCKYRIKLIEYEIAPLKEELKECNRIISEKVKGQIRINQKRRKEIKDEIQSLRWSMHRWFNGGVS